MCLASKKERILKSIFVRVKMAKTSRQLSQKRHKNVNFINPIFVLLNYKYLFSISLK